MNNTSTTQGWNDGYGRKTGHSLILGALISVQYSVLRTQRRHAGIVLRPLLRHLAMWGTYTYDEMIMEIGNTKWME